MEELQIFYKFFRVKHNNIFQCGLLEKKMYMSPIDICQWLEVALGCRNCRGESRSQRRCCSLMRRK